MPLTPLRERRMNELVAYVTKMKAVRYSDLAQHFGMSRYVLSQTILDVHDFHDVILSIPASGNYWTTSVSWTADTRAGEISQLQHNSTRDFNQSLRWRKLAREATSAVQRRRLNNEADAMLAMAIRRDLVMLSMSNPAAYGGSRR